MATYPAVTVSQPGSNLGGADFLALFLKKFSGEIITIFEDLNQLKPLIRSRTSLRGAKAVSFPVLGRASAGYFTKGKNILNDANGLITDFEHTERLIYPDKKLVAATSIDEWDDLINHWEVRSEYARELAGALAREYDFNILKTLAVAANTAASGTGNQFTGGYRLDVNGTSEDETDGASHVINLFKSAAILDERFVPAGDRWAVLSPTAYYALVQQKDVIDADVTVMRNGGLDTGRVKQVAGINLLSCPHIADTTNFRINHTSTAHAPYAAGSEYNDYVVDCRYTKAFVFHKSAIGGVVVQDMAFESEWKIEYQMWMLVAKYIMGLAPLRPECVVEWYDGTP